MSEENKKEELTICGLRFWDLLIQKNLRNLSSMKYQILILMFIFVTIGICTNIIPAITGCSLLGAGFVTLAGTRVYAKTRLTETDDEKEGLDNDYG